MPEPWYLNPDWWQVGITVVGAGIATAAFLSERKAVRTTQRADLLAVALTFRGPITAESRVILVVKNFGPTRANAVQPQIWTGQRGSPREEQEAPPLFAIAAGADMQFPSMPLFQCYDGDRDCVRKIRSGEFNLAVDGSISYYDVFGQRHELNISALFEPGIDLFKMTNGQ